MGQGLRKLPDVFFSKNSSGSGGRGVLKIYIGVVIGFCIGLFFRLPNSSNIQTSTDNNVGSAITESTYLGIMELECLDIQVDNDVHNRVIPLQSDVDKCLIYEPPKSTFVELVLNTVVGTPLQGKCNGGKGGCSKYAAYVEEERLYGNDWPPFGYTMIGKKRLDNFRCAIHEVDKNNIPGKRKEKLLVALAKAKSIGKKQILRCRFFANTIIFSHFVLFGRCNY